MKDRTTLTKSLHTVTVVSRLAMHLMKDAPSMTDTEACRAALEILGYECDWTRTDDTFAACVAKLKTIKAAK